jgi:hypothetical protein
MSDGEFRNGWKPLFAASVVARTRHAPAVLDDIVVVL